MKEEVRRVTLRAFGKLPLAPCIDPFLRDQQEQVKQMCVGDAIGLALLLEAPILVSDELFKQMGVLLADRLTPELVFARYLLKQEGITVPEGKKLRLGHSKTPLRDALVKEFKTSLLGKAPVFPEEDMEQRKKEYLAFLLGESARVYLP